MIKKAQGVSLLEGLPAPDFSKSARVLLETQLTSSRLAALMPSGMLDDVHLAAAELVNNACAATPLERIKFKAVFGNRSILIGVWDSSNEPPRPKVLVELDELPPDANALDEGYDDPDVGGWGLPLVMALTSDRDIDWTPPRGKWVWCRFTLPG